MKDGLKVIGVSGPRTGTASLKVALETLGFGKCYHMEGLFNNPEEVKYWHELFGTGSTDFDVLFDGYQSIVDFPGYMVYKSLYKRYPDALFILNDRDPEEWYDSALNTVYAATPQTFGQKLSIMKKMILSSRFRKIAKVFMLVEKFLWHRQFEGTFKNKEKSIRIYKSYNEEIIRHIPSERLLVYRITDGWRPLCEFLNVSVPEQQFPYKNKRIEFKEQIAQMMKTGEQLTLR